MLKDLGVQTKLQGFFRQVLVPKAPPLVSMRNLSASTPCKAGLVYIWTVRGDLDSAAVISLRHLHGQSLGKNEFVGNQRLEQTVEAHR